MENTFSKRRSQKENLYSNSGLCHPLAHSSKIQYRTCGSIGLINRLRMPHLDRTRSAGTAASTQQVHTLAYASLWYESQRLQDDTHQRSHLPTTTSRRHFRSKIFHTTCPRCCHLPRHQSPSALSAPSKSCTYSKSAQCSYQLWQTGIHREPPIFQGRVLRQRYIQFVLYSVHRWVGRLAFSTDGRCHCTGVQKRHHIMSIAFQGSLRSLLLRRSDALPRKVSVVRRALGQQIR
ncbi:hypothetical protein BC832DRAFT_461163 [Gaertneriomyces semiglobifer]|nr:hypothetical protein BC832DRAFT_461163 [Gaertneriomyces semiglobifer]